MLRLCLLKPLLVSLMATALSAFAIAAPINLSDTKSQQNLEQAFTESQNIGVGDLSRSRGLNDLEWLNKAISDGLYTQSGRNQILTLISHGDYLDAEQAAQNWIAQRPLDPAGHHLLVLALLGQEKDTLLATHLSEIKRLAPTLFDGTALLAATGYARQHKFYRALHILNTPLLTSPAQTLKGQILFQQSRAKEASEALKLALDMNPENLGAAVLLTKISLADSALDDARRYAKVWQKLAPQDVGPSMVITAAAMIDNIPAEASRAIERTLALYPENYVAILDAALLAWRHGDTQRAEQSLKKLEHIDSREPLQLATLIALSTDAPKARQQAQLNIERLFAMDPQDPMHHLLKLAASSKLTEQQLQPLSDLYIDLQSAKIRQQVAQAPSKSWLPLAYNYYLYRQGYFAMALSDAAQQDNPLMQINLARCEWKSGDGESALRAYRSFQESHPDWVIPALEMADIQFFTMGPTAAVNGYQTAQLKHPDWPSLTQRLANLLFTAKEYQKAQGFYQQLVKQFPNNGIFYAQLALSQLAQQESADGLKSAEQAHALMPAHAEVTRVLAQALYSNQQVDRAAQVYLDARNQGVVLELADLLNLADIFAHQKDPKQEKRFLERALSLGIPFQQAERTKQRLGQLDLSS